MNPAIVDFVKLLAQITVEKHYEEITQIMPIMNNKNLKNYDEMRDKEHEWTKLYDANLQE